MVEAILSISRRLLQRVDIRITRRRFGQDYFVPPSDTERLRRLKRFFCSLDLNGSTGYVHTHLDRLARTLTLAPPPGETGRILELGCYMHMAPALKLELGYDEVCGAYYGPAGRRHWKTASIGGREVFRCPIDLFDAEKDRFPYPDSHFDCVLACEIIEHLRLDPMHMLLETRRILAESGSLVLTTPNCASLASLTRALHGFENPQIFSCYPHPAKASDEAPHVREYTPYELKRTLASAGLRVVRMFTDRIDGHEEGTWVYDLLRKNGFDTELRGEQIYCLAVKDSSLPVERYPTALYAE